MRYLLAVLALAGVVVSGLALRVHYSNDVESCSINATWDCGIVNHSPFAEIHHVPVALIGILGYLALIGLALTRQRFGRTMQLYAPLYLSNECVNRCTYCGFSQELAGIRFAFPISRTERFQTVGRGGAREVL